MATDLITKLEEASGPSIALEAEIFWTLERERATAAFWRGAMGLPKPLPDEFSRLPRGLGMASLEAGSPNYTASVDAALALAERVLGEDEALYWLSYVVRRAEEDTVNGCIKGLPLDLCAAILRASEQERGG